MRQNKVESLAALHRLAVAEHRKREREKERERFENAPSTVRELQVTKKYDLIWAGMKLPKGVIFGWDKYGQFFCRDYRVKGYGFDRRTGYPCLVVWRPKGNRCVHNVECNTTTRDILRFYEQKLEEAEEKGQPDPFEIRYKSLNKQAKEVAAQIELRPAYEEVHYTGRRIWQKDKPRGTSLCYVIGKKPIDELW